ncbi:MAG: transketolase [Clostridiales bacterium GWC2_40_7]|nr:MAG: transketolase [Clostridiales bacterium GWC2_40_7]
MDELKALRLAYGEALVELGGKNENIIVLDADLAHATYTCLFQNAHKDRFFNMGIAEQNMVGVAGGLALSGFIPFVSTFAMFGTGRAYEQVRNTICYPNLNVKLALTHSGITVGEDGGSHQTIEDIALMRVLPNMTVIVPCDAVEMKKAVYAAVGYKGPVYLRIARSPSPVIMKEDYDFVIGKGNVLAEGKDICIIATGIMVPEALAAARELSGNGISASVVNIHTIKPLDEELVLTMAKKSRAVVTVEEHSVIGGLGSAVAETLIGKVNVEMKRIGIEDKFGQSGKPAELMKEYGLTSENIVLECRKLVAEKIR